MALWALFGLVGGAFAYRLADRLLETSAVAKAGWLPRCPRCGQVESPFGRIALLALVARHRCPGCGIGPSVPQATVEAITAVLVVLVRLWTPDGVRAAILGLATVVLVVVTMTDLRDRLIPNAVTYPAIVVALALSLLPNGIGPVSAAAGGLVAGGIALAMWLLGLLLYRRADVFGLGDVKLAAFIGAVSGFPLSVLALIAGVFVGGAMGVGMIVFGRSRRATMPYGPALAVGAYLVWLTLPQ